MFSQLFQKIFIHASITFVSLNGIYRLPCNVKPIHYNLSIEPQLTDGKDVEWHNTIFIGSVHIKLQVFETKESITLNVYNLNIDYERVRVIDHQNNDSIIKLVSHSVNSINETHEIVLETNLVIGNYYTIQIDKFWGILDFGQGFYMAKYKVNQTVSKTLAITQFEPTNARRAFPCFDEPALKATFTVSLVRKENYNSVSNEGLDRTEDLGDGRFKDVFKTTPPMSTFLVAFVVSDFSSTEWLDGHRVLGRPSAIKNGDGIYARNIGIQVLKKLENYTGLAYPITKMEQFGVPNGYFFDHAMENYGLVIYNELYMLCNDKSPYKTIKTITTYIVHEFSHQWFGNLVTPQWWDYLWLSESFATYFQFHLAHDLKPSWRLVDQFFIDVVRKAYYREQFRQSGPLNYHIGITGGYPPYHIMYDKGATIVRMLCSFLTPKLFQKGLHVYLTKNMYRNTIPADLYAAFQAVIEYSDSRHLLGNNTVEEIMTTWDSTYGYPVVHAKRDYTTGDVHIRQENVFSNPDNEIRIIPINLFFSEDPNRDFNIVTADVWLVRRKQIVFSLPKNGWLVVNKQQTGYYRVLYDSENWERLIAVLNSDNYTQIHYISRAQLLDDSYNLANRNMLAYDVALRIGAYVSRETEYVPIMTFFDLVSRLSVTARTIKNSLEIFRNYTPNSVKGQRNSTLDMIRAYARESLHNLNEFYKHKPKKSDTILESLIRNQLFRYFHYFTVKSTYKESDVY